MSPQRIQLSRTKGWCKPEGAVVVARPSKWGNPYTLTEIGACFPSLTVEQCQGYAVSAFRDLVRAGDVTVSVRQADGKRVLRTDSYPSATTIRAELAGKDLACWCDLAQPCHADVLLEIANGGAS